MIWFQEAVRFKAEEQKAHSSSAQSNRDNMKLKCSHLIDTLVKKAVQGMFIVQYVFSVHKIFSG
jgi:hypothetical protein